MFSTDFGSPLILALKIDGWKMNFLLGPGLFSGTMSLSLRECILRMSGGYDPYVGQSPHGFGITGYATEFA